MLTHLARRGTFPNDVGFVYALAIGFVALGSLAVLGGLLSQLHLTTRAI
jgi:hypothetical protein